MVYKRDLSRAGRGPFRWPTMLWVGWLDSRSRAYAGFPRRPPSRALIQKLRMFIELGQPRLGITLGRFECNIGSGPCTKTLKVAGRELGSAEIFVCSRVREGVVYRAPDLVLHYVAQHSYAPPPEFVNAVVEAEVSDVPILTDSDIAQMDL